MATAVTISTSLMVLVVAEVVIVIYCNLKSSYNRFSMEDSQRQNNNHVFVIGSAVQPVVLTTLALLLISVPSTLGLVPCEISTFDSAELRKETTSFISCDFSNPAYIGLVWIAIALVNPFFVVSALVTLLIWFGVFSLKDDKDYTWVYHFWKKKISTRAPSRRHWVPQVRIRYAGGQITIEFSPRRGKSLRTENRSLCLFFPRLASSALNIMMYNFDFQIKLQILQ